MNRIRFHQVAILALAVASLGGAPAFAQDPTAALPPVQYAPPSNPDADLLASEMRFLTANPRDLRALLSAAEISTRLGDTSAALAFYARAEKIDPDNPRILAGRGRVLVRMERPGEALALFQQAEQRGLPMGEYLSDRGLAYDLLGAPHLAQRDYREALKRNRDDETVRRYALSLGITGNYDEAMRELDPLLRRSDRAAWRARAFILAMQGDHEGAERIARSMMPGNMGLALNPFFRRLPGLPVSDKAFAVHFGALTPTAARRADAELAPPFAAYVPERAPPAPMPVRVAAVTPAPLVAAPQPRGQRQSRRDRRQPVEIAAATSAATRPPPPAPVANPLPPPPQYQPPIVQPLPIATPTPTPPPAPPPVQLASTTPSPALPTMRRVPGRTSSSAPRPAVDRGPGLSDIMDDIDVPPEELAAMDVPIDEAPAPVTTRTEPVAPPPRRPAAATATPKPATAAPTRAAPLKAEPKPPPEPRRFWVQVGIGANEKLLPATWRKLVKDAPTAFKGKSGWWTPLRATNRLLTGPFKSAAEAQAFVNLLRKSDIDGYVFTSEPGQKVTRLELK